MLDELNQRTKKYLNRSTLISLTVTVVTLALFLLFLLTEVDDGGGVALVLFGVACVFSLIMGLIFKFSSANRAKKALERFCSKTPNPAATMARLEQTWRNGMDFVSGRIDNEFIITLIRGTVNIVSLQQAVWVYGAKQSMNFIPMSANLFVRSREGKTQCLGLSGFHGKRLDMLLSYIFDKCPNIVVGNGADYAKLFKAKNWDELINRARYQRPNA